MEYICIALGIMTGHILTKHPKVEIKDTCHKGTPLVYLYSVNKLELITIAR